MPLIIDWLKIVVSVEVITLADYFIDLGKILWAVAMGLELPHSENRVGHSENNC